jgi:Carboxypeptidase regulatory-like domain/TonB-dependent Receptor Plug Domain
MSRLWLRVVCLLALALAAAPSLAAAQQGTTEIRGRVADAQGAVLPGVTVTVRNLDTGFTRETTSNEDGSYFISGIVPGPYEVTTALTGFKTVKQNVQLEIGKTTTLDLSLDVGAVEETVNVSAEPPIVDVTSKEVGGNITARELTDLPSINRNFVGFIGLLPGIVPNISTESFGSDAISANGGDPRANNYMLDGANNNDDVIGQRAGTQARTPIEAIQEFQVLTGQYDAEFGRTTGAVINAVTKQGTNKFSGVAFGYFQDAGLTQESYFQKKNNLEKPDTAQQQWGGTFGGPIVKNKAHFFFSLERVSIDEGIVVNIPARPDFNGTTTEQTRVWNTMIRGDHQINQNHTWGVRWLREDSPQFNQVIPAANAVTLEASREEQDVDQTIVGSLNSVLGNSRVNTLRVAWTQEDVLFGNPCFNQDRNQAGCNPTLQFLTFTTQQNATAQLRINNAYQIEDTFSWFIPGKGGDHDVRFGAQYQYSDQLFSEQGNLNGTFIFSTNSPFNPNDPRTYPERFTIRVPSGLDYKQHGHTISAFAQDKWKIGRRLTASIGARYDLGISPLPGAQELAHPLLQRVGLSPSTEAPTDRNNIAPRLGFSYDVSGDGRSVIRGGYGMFYEPTRIGTLSGAITNGVFSQSFTLTQPTNAADPGPSQGQRPTNPFLVNGPEVNRALVAQMFPAGATVKNTGNVTIDNANRRDTYSHELSIGYERQLARDLSVNADYIRVAQRGILITRNLNPGVRRDTSRTGTVDRVSADFAANVNTLVNEGETTYNGLQTQLEKRFSHNWSARVSYTLSRAEGNYSGDGTAGSNFQFLDDLNLDDNEGPTDFDRTHNLVVSGSFLVPKTGGLNISWIARALSGLPFSITDSSTDPDRNGILTDPIAAGSYSGNGPDAITVESEGGRNGARGPNYFQLDLRGGYRIGLPDGRKLEAFVDIFNITNRANFTNPTGDRRLTDFLLLTSLRDGAVPRTAQAGVRFVF